ncbi:MAG: molecular chaperone DnaJ [Magnetospirillum sp.]|nr:molecular chaperone DnaJ [Magnetospirillum sp.]
MLIRFVLLVVGAVLLWLGARWLARARPAAVAKMLRLAGLGALVAVGLWLLLTGKLAGLLAVVAGLSPWIVRALQLHTLWRLVRQHILARKGGRASPGQASAVETRFFRMVLDHDSGSLDGDIVDGRWRGRRLSQLDRAQAAALLAEVAVDPPSARVLEAWLDRTWPDWRAQPGGDATRAASGGAMSREEAWQVLGLTPGADAAAIQEAYRRLMRLAHPDQGGSTWIAARLNQARDLLLG